MTVESTVLLRQNKINSKEMNSPINVQASALLPTERGNMNSI